MAGFGGEMADMQAHIAVNFTSLPVNWISFNDDDGSFKAPQTGGYLRPNLATDSQDQRSIGGNSLQGYRALMTLTGMFFWVTGEGHVALSARVDEWLALFRGNTVPTGIVQLGRISVQRIGVTKDDPGHYRVNVVIPFYRDETL